MRERADGYGWRGLEAPPEGAGPRGPGLIHSGIRGYHEYIRIFARLRSTVVHTHHHTKPLLRTVPVLFVLTVVALTACNQPGGAPPAATRDVMYAERWWNTLTPEQMVAALYGTMATEAQATAAKKLYDALDPETKKKVNDAAYAIGGGDEHASVGAWWETLNCQLMRIATGDGNEADPMSPFCAHYPGSGAAKILGEEELAHVNTVGMALLGRSDPGVYPAYVLNPPAWIHGTWGYCGVPASPDFYFLAVLGSPHRADVRGRNLRLRLRRAGKRASGETLGGARSYLVSLRLL